METSLPLPAVSAALDCTSFTRTVVPFLHQLSLSHVLPLLRREVAPLEWYLSTNPLVTAAFFCLAVCAATFAVAEATRNYSQVDRLWPILPTVYVGHYAAYSHLVGGGATARIDTLATFVVLWGARLTYNYARKGGYKFGAEDYRWEVIRAHRLYPRSLPFWVFDLVVIAVFQNLLLFLITAPAYVLTLSSTLPATATAAAAWSTADTVVSRLLPVLLALEALADQQQWSYQRAKRSYRESGGKKVRQGFSGEDLERGFAVGGLWGFSRHPNYACEQAIWIAVYQWTCLVADVVFNWTGIGCALYVLLFQLSTALTEEITAGKYPEYGEYRRLVNRFLPGKSALLGEKEEKEEKEEEEEEEVKKKKKE